MTHAPKPLHEWETTRKPALERLARSYKINPVRDEAYKKWLWLQPCAVAGKKNKRTKIVHACWSPEDRTIGGRFLSDAAHSGKAYSGRIKRADSGCIPLCRWHHEAQEKNMARFDADYGIDRHAIADALYAKFQKERGL